MRLLESTPETVAVNRIRPHPKNPRLGDTQAIAKSIDSHGFYGRILVQRSTGFILAGNHRYLAAVEGGLTEIPVEFGAFLFGWETSGVPRS